MATEVTFDWWQQFLATRCQGIDERIVFTLGMYLLNIVVFWGLNAILYVFYRFNLFPEHRINKGEMPSQELTNECLLHLFFNHFLIYPVIAYFMYPIFVQFGMEINAPVPPITVFLRDFLVSIALNDTLFYWAHRALHHPSIYQYIHKKHHRFNMSIGIASAFAHPVEDVLANLIPTLIGCLLMGSHVIVLWTWLYIRLMETIDAHSGYSFSFSPFHLLPFQGGADRHDFHHSKNVGCYGSFTIFWDWICGTDKAFLDFQRRKAEAAAKQK
jgi:sterol desaturase/sphingolipid hydroxylase (fatty acid hydroxylase superfamily)